MDAFIKGLERKTGGRTRDFPFGNYLSLSAVLLL